MWNGKKSKNSEWWRDRVAIAATMPLTQSHTHRVAYIFLYDNKYKLINAIFNLQCHALSNWAQRRPAENNIKLAQTQDTHTHRIDWGGCRVCVYVCVWDRERESSDKYKKKNYANKNISPLCAVCTVHMLYNAIQSTIFNLNFQRQGNRNGNVAVHIHLISFN